MTTGRPDNEYHHRHEVRTVVADNRDMGSLIGEVAR
jgi:hypothetical protein